MEYTKRFLYQSNQWYNDGLKKANIHDLSGAIISLKKSLQYNRDNIAARNLLGLVYYGRGEVAEALVEWIISKNMKSHENIANYYIKKVQETPSELEMIDQAIRKFNQCLTYCQQEGEDLAVIQLKKVVADHPTFLKAYQLLALLYLQTEQYAKARQVLRKAHRIDTTNEFTLRYMHELTSLHKKRSESLRENKEQSVSYNLGNETIIQPISATLKDNAMLLTFLNIVIGIFVGAAVVWFLIVPAVHSNQAVKTNKEIIAYSDQLASKKNEIRILENELAEYRATNEETVAAKQKAESTQAAYDALIAVMASYATPNYDVAQMVESLLALNTEPFGTVATEQYNAIKADVFGKQCEKLYKSAQASNRAANYKTAIEALEQVIRMDEKYEDGQALLLLANVYNGNGDGEKAQETYNRIIELFPEQDVAKEAVAALNSST